MAYRNKDDCIKIAVEHGISNATELSWPDLQKVVSEIVREDPSVDVEPKPRAKAAATEDPSVTQVDPEVKALLPYLDKTILLSPELTPERYRLIKYDEELGNEVELEERKFDINPETDEVYDISGSPVNHDSQIDTYHDYTTGTYRIKSRSGRKVIGMASVPKENPGLTFRPGVDWATVVTFKGKSGYLWKHWRYPNVSALLRAAGDEYYQKYRKVFKDSPNVWYACGHLVCNPHLVHQVMAEIQEDSKRRDDENKARLKSLGLM